MEPYVGEIRLFAGTFAPQGWFDCSGQTLSISEYETLFVLIGTTYGGDGVNTFNLPNFNGRVPIGQGAGPGLPGYALGQIGGQENVILTAAALPSHSHVALAQNTPATTSNPAAAFPAVPGNGGLMYLDPTQNGVSATNATLAPDVLQPTGGSQAHTNLMPYLGMRYIISWSGIFPSQP